MGRRSQIWLTWALLGVLGALFAAMELAGGSTSPRVLDRFGALLPDLVFGPQAWRLVSSGFIHIGFWHLLANGWSLFVLGPTVEATYGPRGMWTIFVLSVVGGGFAQTAIGHGGAGASGGLFGLIAVYVVYYFRYRNVMEPWERARMQQWLGTVAVLNVYVAISMWDSIGHAAHFGGFVTGIVCSLVMKPAGREETGQAVFTWLVACMSAAAMAFAALHVINPFAALTVFRPPDGAYTLRVPQIMRHAETDGVHAFSNGYQTFAVASWAADADWKDVERARNTDPGYREVRIHEEEGGQAMVVRATLFPEGHEYEVRARVIGGTLYRFEYVAPPAYFAEGYKPFQKFVESLRVRR